MLSRRSASYSPTPHGQAPESYPRGVVQPWCNQSPASSPRHREPSTGGAWESIKEQPHDRSNSEQPVPVVSAGDLESGVGACGSVVARQSLRSRIDVFPRHPWPLDGRLADGTQLNGSSPTMVPFPADGCESNLDLPSHDRQGRGSGPEPSTHGSNTQSLMSHHVSVDPRLVRSDLGHRQANPEINSQSDSFSSGASQRYLSSNTALSAPGDVDIALYSSPLDSQTASGQANASLDSAYSQTAGMSLQTPLHHFPISTQIHGQEDHTQALGSGYNCSFSPAHAPQFGLEPSAQYAISGSSSLEPIAHEASVPLPTSGHSQPARYLPTSDLAYQQQAQSKGKASEADGSADGGRKRKKSKNPNMEVTSESESLEFDGGDERGSRPPGKQSRRKFSTDARRETAETRKTGACIRCRLQRSRVSIHPLQVGAGLTGIAVCHGSGRSDWRMPNLPEREQRVSEGRAQTSVPTV